MTFLDELIRLQKKVWKKTIISFIVITILLIIIVICNRTVNGAENITEFFVLVIVLGVLTTKLITSKDITDATKNNNFISYSL